MKTQIIYSKKCLEYGDPHHPENAERVDAAAKILKNAGYDFIEPSPAKIEDILLAHTREYADGVKNGVINDPDTPAYQNIYDYARRAAGAAILAANTGGFSLMRPPGHHVGKNGAALGAATRGFCYFNNIAIAVRSLCKKTVIIDFDAHHGNGTQEIFARDSQATYISIHRNNVFPQTGSQSCGNCHNYPLAGDCGPEIYFKTFQEALRRAAKEIKDCEIIAVDAGFDGHQNDLVSLGLETDDFFEIGKTIGALDKPAFFILEGGYNGKNLGEDINAFLQGFEI